MWKFIIPLLLACPVMAEDAEYPLLAVTYEVLDGQSDCSEPGQVAFRVESQQRAPVEFYLADLTSLADISEAFRECYIKTRRGEDVTHVATNCPNADEEKLALEAQRTKYCDAIDQIPDNASLNVEVTACLGVNSFKVLDGRWTLSSETIFGSYSTSGNLSGEEGSLKYLAAGVVDNSSSVNVVLAETKTVPARLRFQVTSPDSIVLQTLPDLKLVVATKVDLNILDPSQSDCQQDPNNCLSLWKAEGEQNEFIAVAKAFSPETNFDALPAPSVAKYWLKCHLG